MTPQAVVDERWSDYQITQDTVYKTHTWIQKRHGRGLALTLPPSVQTQESKDLQGYPTTTLEQTPEFLLYFVLQAMSPLITTQTW